MVELCYEGGLCLCPRNDSDYVLRRRQRASQRNVTKFFAWRIVKI